MLIVKLLFTITWAIIYSCVWFILEMGNTLRTYLCGYGEHYDDHTWDNAPIDRYQSYKKYDHRQREWTRETRDEDIEKRNLNLKFYKNEMKSKPWGTNIEEMLDWKGDYRKLEGNHSYIQWLFPTQEYSRNNSYAQPMEFHEAEEIRATPELKERFLRAYKMMLDFYGMELRSELTGEVQRCQRNYNDRFKHLNRSSHNFHRITRILIALGIFGFEHFQAPWLLLMLQEIFKYKTLPDIPFGVIHHWIGAVNNDDDRTKMLIEFTTLSDPADSERHTDSYRASPHSQNNAPDHSGKAKLKHRAGAPNAHRKQDDRMDQHFESYELDVLGEGHGHEHLEQFQKSAHGSRRYKDNYQTDMAGFDNDHCGDNTKVASSEHFDNKGDTEFAQSPSSGKVDKSGHQDLNLSHQLRDSRGCSGTNQADNGQPGAGYDNDRSGNLTELAPSGHRYCYANGEFEISPGDMGTDVDQLTDSMGSMQIQDMDKKPNESVRSGKDIDIGMAATMLASEKWPCQDEIKQAPDGGMPGESDNAERHENNAKDMREQPMDIDMMCSQRQDICSGEDDIQSVILRFYKNKLASAPSGLKIDAMLEWKGDYVKLEGDLFYIHWLFPTGEQSRTNYCVGPIQPHEAQEIRARPELKQRFLRAYKMMLDFYGMELKSDETGEVQICQKNNKDRFEHLNRSQHNWLRITRILTALGIFGFEHYQAPWVSFMLQEIYVHQTLSGIGFDVIQHWIHAINREEDKSTVEIHLIDLSSNSN